jgi:hypothetical protein
VGCILSPLRGWFLGGSSGAEKVPDKLDLTSGAKALVLFQRLNGTHSVAFRSSGQARVELVPFPFVKNPGFFRSQ